MSATDPSRSDGRERRRFPAYGPIEAALGYGLFYVLVDRATPTVVDVVADVLPGVSSLVGLGLALLLWFVLVVSAIDQLRRQLAALGVLSEDPSSSSVWSLAIPPATRATWHVGVLLVGGVVAAVTYERALVTAVDVVRWVAALDAGAFASVEFLVVAVFFVSYSLASHAVDRLVIGGVRALFGT